MSDAVYSRSIVLSGTSQEMLGKAVANRLGLSLGKIDWHLFPDGELGLQIQEHVRGASVYFIQSIALDPSNYLFELLIATDALKRASAREVVAVIPYLGYCRQDRKDKARVPITAKLVANLLEKAGVGHLVTIDLHADQIQGFYDFPVDHLSAKTILCEKVKKIIGKPDVVVAPDIGRAKLAQGYARELGSDFAILHKNRLSAEDVSVVSIIGDVREKVVLLADDLCSTGGTLFKAAEACMQAGAHSVSASVTHGLFVGSAWELLEKSAIKHLFVTDTVPFSLSKSFSSPHVHIASVAPLLSEAIECLACHGSISNLSRV